MSLLPSSRPEVESEQQGDFRLIGFDEEATDDVLEALSSRTARAVLRQLHEEPRTPSELAELEELSIQNVTYHLKKLQSADLIEIVGTQYSEKGREMDVYGSGDEPLVVFVGTDKRKRDLKSLLRRFVGATGLLAVLSILLHSLMVGEPPFLGSPTAGSGPDVVEPTLPLATAIFLGGFAMLVVWLAWLHWEPELDDLLARLRNAPVLVGRDREISRLIAIGAIATSTVLAATWLVVYSLGIPVPGIGPVHPAIWFTLGLVMAASVQAYYNDGLFVSWLIVFGPVAAVVLGFIGIANTGDVVGRMAGIIGYPIIFGFIGSLVFGTTGFVIGAGASRLITRVRETTIEG